MSDQLPHDEELRSLYRRLPADEPRAEIDDAILSAARKLADAAAREVADAAAREVADATAREVAARQRSDRHEGHRRRFWIFPLAAAASVILTVSLTRLLPEQPAVSPSELRESSDSALDYRAAAPEVREGGEAELAAQPLEDAAPGEERNVESRRSESEEAAARARVEARKPAAETSPASDSGAGMAKSAPEASAKVARPKAETAGEEIARLEDRRLAEQKKAGNEHYVESLSRRKADEQQATQQSAPTAGPSSPAAAAPAAPPPAARAPASDAFLSDAARPNAAPASPPAAAMGSRDDTESDKAGEDQAAARGEALAEQAQARQSPATAKTDWPFGLAPGLDAAQACRSLQRVVGASCRYVDGVAVVRPEKAVVIDRGEFKDRKVTRVTLFATGGRLEKIALQVEGFTSEQILVAPRVP